MRYGSILGLFVVMFLALNSGLEAQESVDIKRKERAVRKLLRRGAAFFKSNPIGLSCHKFTHDPSWRDGELFLFLLDLDGTCYTFGDERSRIWSNFADYKDAVGTPIISRFLQKNRRRAISVMFNNASMHLHIRQINKDGKIFLMGCGFYPESVEYVIVDLVYRAAEVLRELGLQNGFSEINNPFGHLVSGNSFVFVVGDDGIFYAQGGERAKIGKSIFAPSPEPPDSQAYRDQEELRRVLIGFLKSNKREGWLEPFEYDNAMQRIFAIKYKDPKTYKKFIVASFYYPEIDDDSIYSLVQKAITYMKAQGRKEAIGEFNTPHGPLGFGPARISVYEIDGMCLAHGEDTSFVGYNLIDRADSQGHFPIKRLIDEVALHGHAWISQFERNAYKLTYAERIDLPDGPLIVASGYWPNSEALTVSSMVERAVGYVERRGKGAALAKFTGHDSDFLRGSVHVTVLDAEGTILTKGPYQKHAIWSDMDLRDRFGRRIVDQIIQTGSQGGGWTRYSHNNAEFRAYTQMVNAPDVKNPSDATMMIMAGYYV